MQISLLNEALKKLGVDLQPQVKDDSEEIKAQIQRERLNGELEAIRAQNRAIVAIQEKNIN